MTKALKIIYSNSWFVLPVLLFSILNFGNYSFLRYNIDGSLTPSLVNNIKYLRIVLPLIPLLFLFGSSINLLKLVFISLVKNFDISILLLIVGIRVFFDNDKIYPLWYILSILAFVIMFTVFRVLSKNTIEYLKKVIIFIFVCASIAIPFTFFSIPKLFSTNDILFSSKSAFAYFNLIIIVSSLCYYIVFNVKMRPKHLLFIALNVLIILLSGRRTPFITALLVLGIYIFFYSAGVKTLIAIAGFVLISLTNLDYFSKHFLSIERLQKIDLEEEGYDSSYRARLELRTFYLNMIEGSDFLGVGFGNLEIKNSDKLSTHNTFLTVYLIIGFFGLMAYLLIFLRSIFMVLMTLKKNIIVIYIILFLPLFTINWVETNFLPGQIFFIYTMSVLISPRYLNNNYAK